MLIHNKDNMFIGVCQCFLLFYTVYYHGEDLE
jgi:hypothetical protein